MIVLGLNAFHADSAAAIFRDGVLLAAAEEERFRRIKHWAGFPDQAIRYCLKEAGVTLADVDHLAINSDPKAHLARKFWHVARRRPSPRLLLDRVRNARGRLGIEESLRQSFPHDSFVGALHRVEHHLCHLASCYLVSPFEDAAAISVDGFGDFASAAWGMGRSGEINVDRRVYFPHSLGIFYQALTQYLGFPHYGDEYKIMGLAPYGKPEYMQQLNQVVEARGDGFRLNMRYFRHGRENVPYRWDNGVPEVGTLFTPALEELLGPARPAGSPITQREKDLAHSIQKTYEEVFFSLLRRIHQRYQCDALTVAGGCGMNSVANGKVRRQTPFKSVWVQAAAGDAGGAIGAAALVSAENDVACRSMPDAYLGPSSDDKEYETCLDGAREQLDHAQCEVRRIDEPQALCDEVAAAIAEGLVIGWFQGRMEWGPRALGNRSILCDPRRADMKDILNAKIKRRESFRPFAPSILRDQVTEWFEEDDDVPFMMKVFQIREAQRAKIPAVTHVDGSGRLQTVTTESNPLYYRLISTFAGMTGVPILLNTSFNENEPVVCKPQEALDCFLRTSMDVLAMGPFFVRRHGNANAGG